MWPSQRGDMFWYNEPQFQRYWNYYYQSKEWMCRYLQNRNANAQCHHPVNQLVQHSYRAHHSHSCHTDHSFAHQVSKDDDFVTYTNANDDSDSSEDSKDEFEMVVTEEMIAFFEESERHKREREASKMLSKQSELQGEDLVDLADIKPEQNFHYSVLPPSEQEKSQRAKEIKYLYGKDAAMIHGMETAMQLAFHRYCDTYQPKLWPNMPLKI